MHRNNCEYILQEIVWKINAGFGRQSDKTNHISSIMGILTFMSSIHVMSLKDESGRFFCHFREIFEKCIEYIGKFLIHFREILIFFLLKSGTF